MRTTRNFSTIAMILAAVILSGCSAFGGDKDTPMDPGYTSSNVATTPVTIETLTPAPATTPKTIQGKYIDIEPVLDKLNDMGCVVKTLDLRAVSRGGHVSIVCDQKLDALNIPVENL